MAKKFGIELGRLITIILNQYKTINNRERIEIKDDVLNKLHEEYLSQSQSDLDTFIKIKKLQLWGYVESEISCFLEGKSFYHEVLCQCDLLLKNLKLEKKDEDFQQEFAALYLILRHWYVKNSPKDSDTECFKQLVVSLGTFILGKPQNFLFEALKPEKQTKQAELNRIRYYRQRSKEDIEDYLKKQSYFFGITADLIERFMKKLSSYSKGNT